MARVLWAQRAGPLACSKSPTSSVVLETESRGRKQTVIGPTSGAKGSLMFEKRSSNEDTGKGRKEGRILRKNNEGRWGDYWECEVGGAEKPFPLGEARWPVGVLRTEVNQSMYCTFSARAAELSQVGVWPTKCEGD